MLAVFTATERKIWIAACVVWLVSGATLVGLFVDNHLERVPAASGEYREGLVGNPQYLNPLFAIANPVDRDLVRLIYAGLLKPNPDPKGQRFVPDLAQSLTIDASQKEYRVTLRPNLRWHDGRPLTTDDVVFTIDSILNGDWKSPLAVSFKGITVQKLDDRVLLINLPEPFSHFQEALTVGILPKHLWSNVTNPRLAELNTKPIGSGAYRFYSILKDKQGVAKAYTLERNPYFHDRRPYLGRIVLKFYPDYDTAWKALEANDIDGLGFLPQQYQRSLTQVLPNSYTVLEVQLPQSVSLFFNSTNNARLEDRRVREALDLAIDRASLVRNVLPDAAVALAGPLIAGMPGYGPALPIPKQDLQKAAKLLDDSGWKRMNAQELLDWKTRPKQPIKPAAKSSRGSKTGTPSPPPAPAPLEPPKLPEGLAYHRAKGLEELTLTISAVDRPESTMVAAMVERWWKSIGVNVEVQRFNGEKILSDVITPRKYDVLLYGQLYGTDPDPFPFWHSSQRKAPGLNIAQFNDKRADTLLEKARKESNEQMRSKLYRDFQTLLVEQRAAIFLYSPQYTYVFPANIKGNAVTAIAVPSDRFATITQWYRRTRLAWRW